MPAIAARSTPGSGTKPKAAVMGRNGIANPLDPELVGRI